MNQLDDLKTVWQQQLQVPPLKTKNLALGSQLERELRLLLIGRVIEFMLLLGIASGLIGLIISVHNSAAIVWSASVLLVFTLIAIVAAVGQFWHLWRFSVLDDVATQLYRWGQLLEHKKRWFQLLLWTLPCYPAFMLMFFYLVFGFDFYAQLSSGMVAVYAGSAVLMLPLVWWLHCQFATAAQGKGYRWVQALLGERLIALHRTLLAVQSNC